MDLVFSVMRDFVERLVRLRSWNVMVRIEVREEKEDEKPMRERTRVTVL